MRAWWKIETCISRAHLTSIRLGLQYWGQRGDNIVLFGAAEDVAPCDTHIVGMYSTNSRRTGDKHVKGLILHINQCSIGRAGEGRSSGCSAAPPGVVGRSVGRSGVRPAAGDRIHQCGAVAELFSSLARTVRCRAVICPGGRNACHRSAPLATYTHTQHRSWSEIERREGKGKVSGIWD